MPQGSDVISIVGGVMRWNGDRHPVGVYVLSVASGSFYVGSSGNIRKRFSDHARKLRTGKHKNRHLQRAFDKYGRIVEAKVILVCRRDDLIMYEQLAIDSLQPELNFCRVAGKVDHNAEVRAKLRARAIEQMADPVARAKLSERAREQWKDPEFRKKATEAPRGRVASPETRARMTEAQKLRWASSPNSDEWRKRAGERLLGNKLRVGVPHTEEFKAAMASRQLGKPRSAETKARISATKRARRQTVSEE